MGKFGSAGSVVLHRTGEPAEACVLVGSAFREPLIYLDGNDNPVNIDGWTIEAKGELHEGHWTDDDKLIEDVPVDSPRVKAFAVAIGTDQNATPGLFTIDIEHDALPSEVAKQIPLGADTLPTFYVMVQLSAPRPSILVDQVRVAVGFRRGFGSLGPAT